MDAGTKVYVCWYGRILEGEVADGGMMGMVPVRIPLDGHHPVALFFPQHVYGSPEEISAGEHHKKLVDTNLAGPRPVSLPDAAETLPEATTGTDPVRQFKEAHWDAEHNHLRTDCLDEFYQLWLEAHDMRPPEEVRSYMPVTRQLQTPKPEKPADRPKPRRAVQPVALSLFDQDD